jgi:uncharacterized protein
MARMTTTPAITHLLYLHGFRSSPASAKARVMAAWMAAHQPGVQWWCPQLPTSPRDAAALIERGTAHWPRETMGIIGSSLGGFYATWLACKLECRAVLINPAVFPARDLARYIGEHPVWQAPEDKIFFKSEFVDEIRVMSASTGDSSLLISEQMHSRLLAIIAKGDEVLSWQEMSAAYAGCSVKLIEGGDHALSDFAQAHLGDATRFLGLA